MVNADRVWRFAYLFVCAMCVSCVQCVRRVKRVKECVSIKFCRSVCQQEDQATIFVLLSQKKL
jgi:hypothetical protein